LKFRIQEVLLEELNMNIDKTKLESFDSFSSALSGSFGSMNSDNLASISSVHSTAIPSSGSFSNVNWGGLASISCPLSTAMTSALSFRTENDISSPSWNEVLSYPGWMGHGTLSEQKSSHSPSPKLQGSDQSGSAMPAGPFDLGSLFDRCNCDIQLVNCVLHSFCEQGQQHLASIQSIAAGAQYRDNKAMSFHAVFVRETSCHAYLDLSSCFLSDCPDSTNQDH
jgi:hypothetical protein